MRSTSHNTLMRLRVAINNIPELNGCRIGYHGNLHSTMLEPGNPSSIRYNIIILIEEVEADLGLHLNANIKAKTIQNPELTLNKTIAGAELRGAGLSCILTVASGISVVGSLGAAVPTAGASTIVLVASWTGLATQGIQCLNGVARTVEAYRNQNDNSLQRWDGYSWYSNTILAVDAAGIISGAASLGFAAKSISKLLTLKGALPAEDLLKKMTNAERIAAYRQSIKRISSNPAVASEFDKILRQLRSGTANRLRNDSAVIIRRSAAQVSRLVSEKTSRDLLQQAREVFLTTTGIAASATPTKYVGSASGSVNWAAGHMSNYVINIISGD